MENRKLPALLALAGVVIHELESHTTGALLAEISVVPG